MNKIIPIALIFLLLFQENLFAQNKMNLDVELYNSTTFDGQFGYLSYGFTIGIKKEIKHGAFYFGGNFEYTTNLKGARKLMRNQYLGVSISYILWNLQKRFRPYLDFKFLTQLHSNYKNGFMENSGSFPRSSPMRSGPNFSAGFYQNIPFIGRFTFGFNFKIINNLSLNIGVGIQDILIKFKNLKWKYKLSLNDNDYGIPDNELAETSIKTSKYLSFHFEIGLSYVIFSHKNQK